MIAILTFIFKFIAAVLFSVLISFFSLFFDMLIQEGMIFHGYLKFLVYRIGKKYNKKEFSAIESLPEYRLRFEQHFNFAIKNSIWFKPLGGCLLCANVWHSIFITAPVLWYVSPVFEWWWLFPVIFTSSFYLRYLMNKV